MTGVQTCALPILAEWNSAVIQAEIDAETKANKIAGVDTEGAKLDNEWKKIENRIQLSRENIEASNVTAAEANAQKAVAEWNSAVIQAEIDAETKAEKRRSNQNPYRSK